MKKLLRIITSTIFIAIGAGLIFFSGSALLQAPDWIAAVMYVCLVVIGMAFAAIGWAVIQGANVKDMLRDLFSGISF